MNQDQIAALAAELGLERALALDPDAFARAVQAARSLSARIPRPESLSDEPAHIYVAPQGSKRESPA